MSVAFAVALGALVLLAEPDAQPSDFTAPCQADLDEARKALVQATSARMIRQPSIGMPVHFFRGARNGCARLRFVIDAAGHLQDPIVEHSHPDARFGRMAVRMLSSAVFAPGSEARDEVLMVVGFRVDEPPAEH
ncbi:MAG TPA: hypothetical protein VM847_05940 [Tahibacter sp.]|jgi:hypothetical protein|nr:hypothetical protein [Tahibacter sp.]